MGSVRAPGFLAMDTVAGGEIQGRTGYRQVDGMRRPFGIDVPHQPGAGAGAVAAPQLATAEQRRGGEIGDPVHHHLGPRVAGAVGELEHQGGSGRGAVASPEAATGTRAPRGEQELVAQQHHVLRIRSDHPRMEVGHQPRAIRRAVAAPQLAAEYAVVGAETDLAAHPDHSGRHRAGAAGTEVAEHFRQRQGAARRHRCRARQGCHQGERPQGAWAGHIDGSHGRSPGGHPFHAREGEKATEAEQGAGSAVLRAGGNRGVRRARRAGRAERIPGGDGRAVARSARDPWSGPAFARTAPCPLLPSPRSSTTIPP